MSNIIDDLKREYQYKRIRASRSLDERQRCLYEKYPELEKIDKDIFNAGLKYNRMILNAKEHQGALESLKENIEIQKAKKMKILEKNNYSPDYLELKYDCQKCKDTGFNIETFERCSCFTQKMIELVYEGSNLMATKTENFSAFNENLYSENVNLKKYGISASPRDNIISIKNRCEYFIENFSISDTRNLFFSGSAGTGKTFMANCIAYELLNKGVTVLYQTSPMLFGTIGKYKSSSFGNDTNDEKTYRNIFEVELLIIDDLGTESQSHARYAELLSILNTRQLNNLSRPCKTIISTNLGPRQILEYYTERVASRIVGNFDKLQFAGDDLRR